MTTPNKRKTQPPQRLSPPTVTESFAIPWRLVLDHCADVMVEGELRDMLAVELLAHRMDSWLSVRQQQQQPRPPTAGTTPYLRAWNFLTTLSLSKSDDDAQKYDKWAEQWHQKMSSLDTLAQVNAYVPQKKALATIQRELVDMMKQMESEEGGWPEGSMDKTCRAILEGSSAPKKARTAESSQEQDSTNTVDDANKTHNKTGSAMKELCETPQGKENSQSQQSTSSKLGCPGSSTQAAAMVLADLQSDVV